MKETHLSVLQTALRSSGRFLLVQNIPSSATRRDMTGMFRGFRLLEGDSVGPCAPPAALPMLCCRPHSPVLKPLPASAAGYVISPQ